MLRVGETVGAYDIVAKLRSGGMATLFLGKKRGAAGFTRHVAIKVIHEHLASDPDFVRMFVDEAMLQARIQNPHVVHVEELGDSGGAHFLVMEYVHGCALAQLLLALGKRKRRPQVDLAVSIALQTLAGLHAAHELRGDDGRSLGVVHRDVSPQNVLLSRDGHVKLIDFGVAKAASSSQQTQGAMLKGKLRYMPPEQAFGKSVDRRADIYALGIVLWEMLTMRKLFGAKDDLALLDMVRNPQIDPPSRWAPEVPAALDRVVLKALAREPSARFQTCQEMRRALAEAVPAATLVEPSSIAELIEAAVGDELEKERLALPAAVGAQVAPPAESTRVHVEEVLLTLTVSAAGLEVRSGMSPISASAAEVLGGPVLPPGATPAPAPVSSVAIGTPSQPQSNELPLSDVGSLPPSQRNMSTARMLPRVEGPPPARPSYFLYGLAAVAVIGLVGGGTAAYILRSRVPPSIVASPLPVRDSATGSLPVVTPPVDPVVPALEGPPSVPSVPTAPSPSEGAGLGPVPAAEPTAEPTAEPALEHGAEPTATHTTRPRTGGRVRPRGERHDDDEGGTRTGGGTDPPMVDEF